jgi:diguanylate cyclase (GGDEF)-like protein
MILAERLRDHVQRVTVEIQPGQPQAVTISIGIAGYPEHAADVQTLLQRSDQALYQAKAAGRNQAVHYEANVDG